MQTVPELMSALANPSVANAMFDTGETQVSTKKILGAALVVIFILAVLLLWSLLRRWHPAALGQTVPPAMSPAARRCPRHRRRRTCS